MYGCVHVPLSVFGIVLLMFSLVSCVHMSFWCVSLSVFGCVILPDFLMCWCVVSCMVFGVHVECGVVFCVELSVSL